MIFSPEHTVIGDGVYLLDAQVTATCHPVLAKEIYREFFHNFSFGFSSLSTVSTDRLLFQIGEAAPLPLENCDYTLHVCKNGICIAADSEKNLICGFMTLLDRIEPTDTASGAVAQIECVAIRESAKIKNRMVHYCVFPEVEPWEFERFIRFCGALRYTHIIVEFWGTLPFDCMRELGWKTAYQKEDIRRIFRLARDLGLEIIPMFNHWGHASQCRVGYGKHVVLDQNPQLESYFTHNGWCWDISKPKVRALHKQIRAELMELAGDGTYFHIGCDEAYGFTGTDREIADITGYINEIARDLESCGRRAIVWEDMFLAVHETYNPDNAYECNAKSVAVEEKFLAQLSKNLVIADWQYHVTLSPVETAVHLKNCGFDTLLCPWDKGSQQLMACIDTIKNENLFGLIHTTWHTLQRGTKFVSAAGLLCYEDRPNRGWGPELQTATAALLRKVFPANGNYENSGWSKLQINHTYPFH